MSDGPQHPATPASDTERESTIGLLRQAVVDGRLTLEEFSDRVGQAQVARTDQDLAVLGSDLPAAPAAAPLDDTVRHLALCSRLVRSGLWEIPARSSYRCLFATIGIRAGGPDGTLYVRNQRERPNRWFKLLGKGDTYA